MSERDLERAQAAFRAGRFEDALTALDAALKSFPNRADLWNNRGVALTRLNRLAEAETAFGRALALNPNLRGAHANRANALLTLRRYEEAAQEFEQALAADPDLSYARGNLLQCRMQACDWRDFERDRARLIDEVRKGRRSASPLAITAFLDSPEDQLLAAQILAADKFPPAPPLWRGERYAHQRTRLAYVSADFSAHATATLMAGVFEHHDRTQFEIFAISLGPNDGSPMRTRLEAAFEHFTDAGDRSDIAIARLLRELEIDIAVDLKGYTSEARPGIFACRPAPVQASYLGYPGTMGARSIDYLIADRIAIPVESERRYSEKIVRLPGSYQANDRARPIASDSPSRAEAGLPDTGFVFCCFNNSYKILPQMFEVWMKLLRAVEGSVLWLLEDNPAATRNLRHEAEARGISGSRLIFAPRLAPPQHLARHRLAGLFLDTLPYNAHTTASDALWAGLPLVTCTGQTFAGRVAASLLHAAGLPELVTESLTDYEALALRLAREPTTLASIRSKLARHRDTCALFDTARFTRHLEAAYAAMQSRTARGLPPESFAVGQPDLTAPQTGFES